MTFLFGFLAGMVSVPILYVLGVVYLIWKEESGK